MILETEDTEDIIEMVAKRTVDAGDMSEGDLAVITAGHPIWEAGTDCTRCAIIRSTSRLNWKFVISTRRSTIFYLTSGKD